MDYLHHMTIFYTSGNTPSTFFYLRYLEEVAGKMTRQQLPVPFSPINLENTLGAWLTCYTWPRWRFLEKSSSQRSLSVSTPTSRMPSRCAIGQILNGPNHVKLAICIPTWLHWRNRQKLANFLLRFDSTNFGFGSLTKLLLDNGNNVLFSLSQGKDSLWNPHDNNIMVLNSMIHLVITSDDDCEIIQLA